MNILIVGSGGREHAIAAAVAKSSRADKIYCAPGNAGIGQLAECVPIGAMEFDKLAAFAKEYNIAYACIPAIKVCGETVSSSKIRALLQLGAVDQATALLGRPYTITGRVTRGRRLGHSLGFPTANLALPTAIVVPADGVYITRVRVNGALFDAVTDIGYKPTVSHTGEKICESHLLNGETELYGATISVSFLKRLRNEIRFQDAADLTRQIHTDVADAQAFFNLHPLHTV